MAKELFPVPFYSRHLPTEAQRHQAAKMGLELVPEDRDFEKQGLPYCALEDAQGRLPVITGVFPLDVLASAQLAGLTVVTWVTTERGVRVDQATTDQIKPVTFPANKNGTFENGVAVHVERVAPLLVDISDAAMVGGWGSMEGSRNILRGL